MTDQDAERLKLARECGALRDKHHSTDFRFTEEDLLALIRASEVRGMRKAAGICEDVRPKEYGTPKSAIGGCKEHIEQAAADMEAGRG